MMKRISIILLALCLAATATLLALTALVAAWLPARRAARVEPRIAMQDGM